MNSKFQYLLFIYLIFGGSYLSLGEEKSLEEFLIKYNVKEYLVIRQKRDFKNWYTPKQSIILSNKEETKVQEKLTKEMDFLIKDNNPMLKRVDIEYWGLKEFFMGVKDKNGSLHDILVVNKLELGSKYYQRIKKKNSDILMSLTQKDQSNINKYNFSSDLFSNAESKLNSNIIDEELLLKISPNLIINDQEISLQKESINRTINELKSTYIKGQNAFNSKMQVKTDSLINKLGKSLKAVGNFINTQSQQLNTTNFRLNN